MTHNDSSVPMKEDAKHTPLPWRVFDGGGEIGNGGVLAIMSSAKKKNEVIAWGGFDASNYPHQARANAELIVTSVNERADLLSRIREAERALRAIVDFCDDPNGSENPESLATGLSRLLPAARTALTQESDSGER
jgi:hypothetical protein